MSSDIAVQRYSTPAVSFAEKERLAEVVAESKIFGITTAAQALTLMALCESEGLHPMQAVRRFHLINGRASMRADAMLAEFQARGGKVAWGERSNTLVSGTFSHPSGGDLTVTWTLKDAQEAQLTGNPTWKKFPRQMLTARVISEAIRTVLPGVVAGIYAPEEVEDFAPDRPLRQPAPKSIEAPVKTIEAAPVDPTREARAAFYSTCDRLNVPIRGEDGKASPVKVMAVLHCLGWPQATPPATASDWEKSEELLVAADAEGALDSLRGQADSVVVEDLTDPFAEEAPNA